MNLIYSSLKQWYKIFFIIFTPIILLPIRIILPQDSWRCAYVVAILLIYWISECIPVPVTSLLPLILFPLSGVLTAADVAPNYFTDTATFLFGSVSLAYAVQRVNLHRRIALLILTFVGSSTKWIMAGLMSTAFFLSMWMNNAACTSIMLPIVLTIAKEYQLEENQQSTNNNEDDLRNVSVVSNPVNQSEQGEITSKHIIQLRKGFILSITYGAIYGGLSTIVGSAVTIFLKGYVDEEYGGKTFRVTFVNYFLLAFPIGILLMIIAWIYLQIRFNFHDFIRWRCCRNNRLKEREKYLKETLHRQYKELGSLRWNEGIVILLFLMTIVLWVVRDIVGKPNGWKELFLSSYASNGTIVLFAAILTLILPNERPALKNWKYNPILTWSDLSKNYPWGTLTFVGAGLSISEAFRVSKLNDDLGDALKFLDNSSNIVILIIIIVISEICTQFINNLSVASILFPVLTTLSNHGGIHPGRFLLPSALGISLGFLLPISSQSNSLLFAGGHIKTKDLMTNGIVMMIIGGLVVFFASTTWMIPIFHLNDSFSPINSTLIS